MNQILKIVTILIFSLMFVACVPSDDPVWYFFDEPAIITYDGSSVVLNTSLGPYPAPELDGKGLAEGQCLISDFILDYAFSPLIASAITYFQVNNSSVRIREGAMTDDFTDSIASAKISPNYVAATLFFSFETHTPNNDAKYLYELVCNTDSITIGKNGKPVYSMYFRSKNAANGAVPIEKEKKKYYYFYAFDMGDFARTYQEDSLYINFYYYNKTKKGEEIYTALGDNPKRFKFPVPAQ